MLKLIAMAKIWIFYKKLLGTSATLVVTSALLVVSNKDASARQPLAKTVSKLSSEEVLDDVVVWSLKGRQTE